MEMNDNKEGGISEKKMEKIVRNILIGMMSIVVITLLSMRGCEEYIKYEQKQEQAPASTTP